MMNMRNIKLWICVACLASSLAAPAPSQSPQLYLDIIDMAAISRMTPQQLEALAEGLAAEEIMRTKRSSAQALTSVVSKASSGLQSKVGLLGQASAFIGSASSKSGGHDEHQGYSYEPQDEKYDYWGLKKSILYTLFQAVKAITGGVTILKGQLIKGGGALAATLGKVISVKGDAVSNLGKKIVSSAALSQKKPHSTPAVYGPPPTTHLEYGPPTAYGAPTAAAHFTAPSVPTGYASHKYPAQFDGRGKLNGVHAGLVFLTPLGEEAETLDTAHSGHTPLEPPPSILHTVYSAIKNAFSSTAPSMTAPAPAHTAPSTSYGVPAPSYGAPPPAYGPPSASYGVPAPSYTAPAQVEASYQPPPPPQPVPNFKPMSWGAVDSYGQPAAVDTYPDFDPRNPSAPVQSYDYASAKRAVVPTTHYVKTGLTPEKIQKIRTNLKKVTDYLNEHKRSSEDFKLTDLDTYKSMLEKGQIPFLPTPVVSDNEIGVLPAEVLDPLTTTTSTTTTTTTTTEKPKTTTENEQNRRKDVKYYLRGNKIVQV
ncbi:uncharacterized protein LOC142973488 [Anticarsia gemmatalis]|uniref:uncharacterized protein LOC142973488 n=1 Tax=Anticarsia gemmatalis TaxID=129554 RepID=UPI003F759082